MKANNIFDVRRWSRALALAFLAVVTVVGFTACSDDDKYTGDPYFEFENVSGPIQLKSAGIKHEFGTAQQVVIRSNRPWRLEAQSEDTWCVVYPMEGDLDGIIRISAEENMSPMPRMMNYKVYVDGQESPTILTIEQVACEPFVRVSTNAVTISNKGGNTPVDVTANVEWDWALIDDANGVFAVTETETGLMVTAANANKTGEDITAKLVIKGKGEFSNLVQEIQLTQMGGTIVMFENFSWLNYGSILGWDTTGETQITKWTAEELGHGWTSRSTWCYSRPGFIKLGKTSYGGDVVSPELKELKGTTDVLVKFQAVGYTSSGGTIDDQILYVAVIGGGKIELVDDRGMLVNGIAYKDANKSDISLNGVAMFQLDPDNHFTKAIDATGLQIWGEEMTKYKFRILGATKQTQIVFMGGAFDAALKTVGVGKNRIFLDNIQVVE